METMASCIHGVDVNHLENHYRPQTPLRATSTFLARNVKTNKKSNKNRSISKATRQRNPTLLYAAVVALRLPFVATALPVLVVTTTTDTSSSNSTTRQYARHVYSAPYMLG